MTYFLAVTAGLQPEHTAIMAYAAQYIDDDDKITSPLTATGIANGALAKISYKFMRGKRYLSVDRLRLEKTPNAHINVSTIVVINSASKC